MKKRLVSALAGLSIAVGAFGTASAAVTLDKASCSLESTSCLFNGNANINKSYEIDNAYNAQSPAPMPALSLESMLSGTVDGSLLPKHGGTYTADFLVSYFAVKAGNQFMLYKLDAPSTTFEWSTAGLVNKKGIEHDVSHIAFWGSELSSAVPEPATWAMMIMGFGLAGAALRRRPRLAVA